MIQKERLQLLNHKKTKNGQFVLYWMQAAQRASFNHALNYAIEKANDLSQPLVCLFVLTADFPEANVRHYQFMLEGLKETSDLIKNKGIQFVLQIGDPALIVTEFCRNSSYLVTDRGYLKIQKQWRSLIASKIKCPMIQVESEAIVPINTASNKEEYSAATLRKKIMGQLDFFLKPVEELLPEKDSLHLTFPSKSLSDINGLLQELRLLSSIHPVEKPGGYCAAKKRLEAFIDLKLNDYDEKRNDPNLDFTSGLSPYLHFGQISPLEIAIRVKNSHQNGVNAFLEQLVVRRELSFNFTEYNLQYDSFQCLPQWAQTTLKNHENDKRPYLYSRKELENAQTHDSYWNAAQKEMVLTGKMANYMRMYWGKKILEWSLKPEEAYQTALYLNNKYQLDGRDPNAFAGIAWCFGKHDRPWQNRPIFGNIRYMNDSGLKRKFDIDAYAQKYLNLKPDFFTL